MCPEYNATIMINFFKSLFLGETEQTDEEKIARNFDVLKYDGIKALKAGKTTYAIRCFNEALKLREDAEVLDHLVNAYTREDRMEEAIVTASRMVEIEPENIQVLLLRANLNFLAEKYTDVITDSEKVVALDPANSTAYFLQGKARKAAGKQLEAIVGLSQAIRLKEDFAEARLLRAEIMLDAGDYKDGMEDAERGMR